MKTKITAQRGGYTQNIDRVRVTRTDAKLGPRLYWVEARTNPLNDQWATVLMCLLKSTADRTCRRLAEGGTFLCRDNSITKIN